MLRSIICIMLTLLVLTPRSDAWITGWIELSAIDGNGTLPGSYTFDLIAQPVGSPYYDEDWTTAGMYGTLTGGTFYQDPHNDTNPPDPALFYQYPESEWTSFYTGPEAWPNPEVPDYPGIGFASYDDTATMLYTEWYDVVDTGEGTFTLARVTVLPDSPDWWLDIEVRLARVSGDSLFYYTFAIPEPCSLGLLAVGGIVAIGRWRRSASM